MIVKYFVGMQLNRVSFRQVFVLASCLWMASCSAGLQKLNQSETALNEVLNTMANTRFGNENHPLGNLSHELFDKQNAFWSEQLQALKNIDEQKLSENDQITRDLMMFELQDRLDEIRFETYLNPLQADQGFHLDLVYSIRPILSARDADRYLNVLNDIPHFTEMNIGLIREGLKKGISQPRVIFKGYEDTYNHHLVSNYEESDFFGPFKDLPNNLGADKRDSILREAKLAIENSVLPSFAKIKQFFEQEYLPQARTSLGVSALNGGREFYQNRINYFTTSTAYTAESIHELGLTEVARIRREMESIISELAYEGDFESFLNFLRTDPQFYAKTPAELLMRARDIAKRIDAQLPKYFKILPRKPYGVIAVPEAIAPKYTGGRYSPPRGETEAGYYLVNTYNLPARPFYVLPALTAHEAVPGHHLQIALHSELGDSIPRFRKNIYFSAYGEGWGLYAEYLANEMGIYTTPYERFGQLTYEMWRACRLVVDTGIHAFDWTREQVVDYMKSNTALSLHEINTETDRYIGWPAQALSYKIGELKIRELRSKAEEALGTKFDIRDFHALILDQGTVTLPILEKRVMAYINAQAGK